MDENRSHTTEKILNLTLEILYLLTGEDCLMVKSNGEWVTPHSLIHERINDQKILDLTNNIIHLLTGEVPIRCQDVAVYFSMEEWEYIEGHQDLYKDAMKINHGDGTLGTYRLRKPPDGPRVESDDPSDDHLPETRIIRSQETFNTVSEDKERPQVTSGEEEQHDVRPCPSPSLERKMHVTPGDHTATHTCLPGEDLSSSEPQSRESCKSPFPADTEERPCRREATAASDTSPMTQESVRVRPEVTSIEDGTQVEMHTVTEPEPPMTTIHRRDTDSLKPTCWVTSDAIARHARAVADSEIEENIRDLPGTKPEVAPSPCNGEITLKSTFCRGLARQKTGHVEEKPFSCSECGERFSRTLELVEHHRVHSEEKPFACPECGKQFADRANVIAHQVIHSKADEAPVLCSDCGMAFNGSADLAEHQKIHQQEKKFLCPTCGKGFSRRGHLSNHNRIHTGGKRVSYSESGEIIPHISYVRKRPFLCLECGKCFPSRSHLDRHQRVHTGEKPFSCLECDKRFTDRSGLVIHQRIHTGEKPYSCNDCGKCFRDRSGLVVHQRNHTGQHPFRCLECGKCFHNRARLERHEHAHREEKSFPCPECEQCFTSMSALALHYKTHMEQTSVPGLESFSTQDFPCAECGKRFPDSSALSLHYRTHMVEQRQRILNGESGFESPEGVPHPLSHVVNRSAPTLEKPFPCSQCDRVFSDRTSLIAHEQQHAEDKPYRCLTCGEGFVLKGYLTKHLETHA